MAGLFIWPAGILVWRWWRVRVGIGGARILAERSNSGVGGFVDAWKARVTRTTHATSLRTTSFSTPSRPSERGKLRMLGLLSAGLFTTRLHSSPLQRECGGSCLPHNSMSPGGPAKAGPARFFVCGCSGWGGLPDIGAKGRRGRGGAKLNEPGRAADRYEDQPRERPMTCAVPVTPRRLTGNGRRGKTK